MKKARDARVFFGRGVGNHIHFGQGLGEGGAAVELEDILVRHSVA